MASQLNPYLNFNGNAEFGVSWLVNISQPQL
jgi:hypothetical protein